MLQKNVIRLSSHTNGLMEEIKRQGQLLLLENFGLRAVDIKGDQAGFSTRCVDTQDDAVDHISASIS